MIPLLFHRNRLLQYRGNVRACPCFNNNFTKCLYPGAPITNKVDVGFKDEPNVQQFTYCIYRRYHGPIYVDMNRLARKEFEELIARYTQCFHPQEGEMITEWRCYKCNAKVPDERFRHKCP